MRRKPSALRVYHEESRQVGRSLALVVPLLVAYEIAVAFLAPQIRNSAELAVAQFVRQLPQHAVTVLRYAFLAALVGGALWWLRDTRPRDVAGSYEIDAPVFCIRDVLRPG